MDYKSMGLRIRKHRKSMRLTQEELAERTGISLSFLGHIERGSRKASIETLVALSNALTLSTDVLLQESLSEDVLTHRETDRKQRDVLREISKIILDNNEVWSE